MNVLAIDTTNHILGVALLSNNKVLGEIVTDSKRGQTERLMPAIEFIMNEASMVPEQLDRIVVAEGPGSYTGVRIGITTAKTLAWSLNIPVVAVSSLELLAYNGKNFPEFISPFFDARRGTVFTGLYKWIDNTIVQVSDHTNVLMEDWLNMLKERNDQVLFISPHIDLHREKIIDRLGASSVVLDDVFNYPRPSHLAKIGIERESVDQFSLTPNYLRLAEAEVNWLKEQKENK
ncbi:MAG TPA: tRNA (adenosine(37)-N6)-threonylcarbamoyltransferase complex dimerization subunit type 1 TsaB [Bacillota bacterium]|nr:tRNA (adenosine(37)-N6)-threonylcarbamoyltransferase complex dimerization subunit type 1 TsaB [Bacillota bacterium]